MLQVSLFLKYSDHIDRCEHEKKSSTRIFNFDYLCTALEHDKHKLEVSGQVEQ